jgi:uncharacterized protein YutE (UPF0331/DUF86 family)
MERKKKDIQLAGEILRFQKRISNIMNRHCELPATVVYNAHVYATVCFYMLQICWRIENMGYEAQSDILDSINSEYTIRHLKVFKDSLYKRYEKIDKSEMVYVITGALSDDFLKVIMKWSEDNEKEGAAATTTNAKV